MFRSKFYSSIIIITLLLIFVGCEREMSLNPEPVGSKNPAPGFESVASQDAGEYEDGQVYAAGKRYQILKVHPEFQKDRRMNPGGDTLFTASKFIAKELGGMVNVGDWNYGFSTLNFTPGDLPESDTIHFEWAPQSTLDGLLTGMEFGPHGTNFDGPVYLSISYKMADMEGIDENELVFVYLNDETGEWEVIPHQINRWFKIVSVYLNHFSRYALAHG